MWVTSSEARLLRRVVFPALSKPSKSMRNSWSGFDRSFLRSERRPILIQEVRKPWKLSLCYIRIERSQSKRDYKFKPNKSKDGTIELSRWAPETETSSIKYETNVSRALVSKFQTNRHLVIWDDGYINTTRLEFINLMHNEFNWIEMPQ